MRKAKYRIKKQTLRNGTFRYVPQYKAGFFGPWRGLKMHFGVKEDAERYLQKNFINLEVVKEEIEEVGV